MSHSAQMSAVFSNGLPFSSPSSSASSSSVTRRLQSYLNTAAELSAKSLYPCDLLGHGAKEVQISQNTDAEGRFEKPELERGTEADEAVKWKLLKKVEELGHGSADVQQLDELGLWNQPVSESPISSPENLAPGPANQHQQQQQGGLLSFHRTQGNLSGPLAGKHKASVNGGVGDTELDVALGEHHFIYHVCSIFLSAKLLP